MRDSKIDQKQPVVKEIAALLDGAQAAVVVDYRGLTVAQDTELRKQLREAGVVYKVYKNTMVRIAAKGTEFEQFDQYLEGPTALAVSKEDATAPALLLRHVLSRSSRRPLRSLSSRAVSLKESCSTQQEWQQLQKSRQERSCLADCSAACRARLQTLPA